jgi:hypothetical protein
MAAASHCNAAAAREFLHPLLPLLGQALERRHHALQGVPHSEKVRPTELVPLAAAL